MVQQREGTDLTSQNPIGKASQSLSSTESLDLVTEMASLLIKNLEMGANLRKSQLENSEPELPINDRKKRNINSLCVLLQPAKNRNQASLDNFKNSLYNNADLNKAMEEYSIPTQSEASAIVGLALHAAGFNKKAPTKPLWPVLFGGFGLISIVLTVIDMLGFYAPNLIGSAANFLGTVSLGGAAGAIPGGLVLLPFAILIAVVAILYLFKTFSSGDKTSHLKTAPPRAGATPAPSSTSPQHHQHHQHHQQHQQPGPSSYTRNQTVGASNS